MCGIVGAAALSGAGVSVKMITALTTLLHHRGPDDRGVVTSGAVAFGHARLSILGVDAPAARQPVSDAGTLLSYNGEIYNFKELAERLAAQGIQISGESDTEVLFQCLRHWGVEDTLARIDGMFAFAYFDPATQILNIARDRIGEKPLYWSKTGHRFWFASEAKVIIASGDVSPEPNLARIDDYLYTTKINGNETIFRHVSEVEPGTRLEVNIRTGNVNVRPYWCIEDTVGDGADGDGGEGLTEEFSRRLEAAVDSRMVSDVPIGVLLSGGIDSNTLAELLLAGAPRYGLDLFFADNANESVSERPDVEVFLNGLRQRYPDAGLNFFPGLVAFEEYFDRLRKLTWFYDEPVQFQNSPLLDGLCQRAHARDLKVLLSGEGADEILYGYDRFARTADQLADIKNRGERLRHLYFGGGLASMGDIRELTQGVAEGAEATQPWRWLDENLDRWPLHDLQAVYSQKYRLQILLQRQDRIGMAHSLELRVPFLMPALVDWANRLPLEAKYDSKNGQTKRILRRAMAARLPERILRKAKDGFPTDMSVWLREGQVRDIVHDYIADANGFCQSYLNGKKALSIADAHFNGEAPRDMLLWQLLSLEIWHRTFASGVTPPAASTLH